jgi:Domain of unknown function (DUF4395)
MSTRQLLDQSALKFNQLSIVALTVLGFILNQPILPMIVAAVLIGGSFTTKLAVFKLIYRHALKPLHLMAPNLIEESSAPHEFAQLLGGFVLGIGSLLLISGSPVIGWALAWTVVFLAMANLVFGFCAGCFVYFQLGRFGVPGFSHVYDHNTVQR